MNMFNILCRCYSVIKRVDRKWISIGYRRQMSTLYIAEFNQASKKYNALLEEVNSDRETLLDSFPMFLQRVKSCSNEIAEHLENVLQYNVPVGAAGLLTGFTGLITFGSARLFRNDSEEKMTPDGLFDAIILSWCSELFTTYANVEDDIVDNGKIRNGKPAWHKKADVGRYAVNDCFLMNLTILKMLKTHYGSKPYYLDLVNNYTEHAWRLHVGVTLDTKYFVNKTDRKFDFDSFTMHNYQNLVNFKTVSVVLGQAKAGMIMNGITDHKAHVQMDYFFTQFGFLCQILNDAIDCWEMYGSEASKDIMDGQFTWFLTKALEIGSREQVQAIKDNYGKQDIECQKLVKTVYKELKLEDLHKEFAQSTLRELWAAIHGPTWGFSPHYFLYCLTLMIRYESALTNIKDLLTSRPNIA